MQTFEDFSVVSHHTHTPCTHPPHPPTHTLSTYPPHTHTHTNCDQEMSVCCHKLNVFWSLNYCIRRARASARVHTHTHSVAGKSALGSEQAKAIWCPALTLSTSQLHTWEAASPASVVGPPTAHPPASSPLTLSSLLPARRSRKPPRTSLICDSSALHHHPCDPVEPGFRF